MQPPEGYEICGTIAGEIIGKDWIFRVRGYAEWHSVANAGERISPIHTWLFEYAKPIAEPVKPDPQTQPEWPPMFEGFDFVGLSRHGMPLADIDRLYGLSADGKPLTLIGASVHFLHGYTIAHGPLYKQSKPVCPACGKPLEAEK